jgi:hypothetical protein
MGDMEPSEQAPDIGHGLLNGRRSMYGLSSNQSSSSIFEDVEMAHDEVSLKRLYGRIVL